jgi:hypothetical protein
LVTPLGIAIARGSSEAAAQGIGADARLAELAVPLRELRAGNPRPLLENTWTTLGMFHATGDPEWLYNIPNRPVFNLVGGALFWAGVALCLYRWREPRHFFLLLWLGLGLLPAFVSTPPASLSHTIMAQPVVYVLPALALAQAHRWLRLANRQTSQFHMSVNFVRVNEVHTEAEATQSAAQAPDSRATRTTQRVPVALAGLAILALLFLGSNAVRDLRDYFVAWPQRGMVRFLYRADYRETAQYLNAHPEIADVAVSSALLGPWDRLALEVDSQRDDVAVRLFNPERALTYPAGERPYPYEGKRSGSYLILLDHPTPGPVVGGAIEQDTVQWAAAPLSVEGGTAAPFHVLAYVEQQAWWPQRDTGWHAQAASFANGLSLLGWSWPEGGPAPGLTVPCLTGWQVSGPLDLPPIPIVANPPPPGVYHGPRLLVFAHLLAADGTFLAGDDGLWTDPLTLQRGDRFLQVHLFALPDDAPPGPYTLELGLYDPMTGDRWPVLDAEGQPGLDRFLDPVGEDVQPPSHLRGGQGTLGATLTRNPPPPRLRGGTEGGDSG